MGPLGPQVWRAWLGFVQIHLRIYNMMLTTNFLKPVMHFKIESKIKSHLWRLQKLRHFYRMNRFLPHQMGRCNVMLLPLTNNFTVFPKVPRGGRLQCLEEHQTSNNTNEGHHCDKLIMDFFVIYKLTEPLCEEIWLSDLKIDHCVFEKICCSSNELSFPGS